MYSWEQFHFFLFFLRYTDNALIHRDKTLQKGHHGAILQMVTLAFSMDVHVHYFAVGNYHMK